MDFKGFGKIPRLSREVVITEKIDGTNGIIAITADGETIYAGSRNKWLAIVGNGANGVDINGVNVNIMDDNAGFAKWVAANYKELLKLGPGYHYGEWWGGNIQRGYGLKEKRFSLFNTSVWSDDTIRPSCCHVVPVLFSGTFDTVIIQDVLDALARDGSKAAPGFMRPEGIIIYHVAGGYYFKKTIEKDDTPKSV